MNSMGYTSTHRGSFADGTPGVGVTAVTKGDGGNMVTTLTMDGAVLPAITGGGAQAVGLKVFDFPAGVTRTKAVHMSVGITQSEGNINLDTPEVGVGSVIATGGVSVLNGTTGFDDYVDETTAANCTGTETDLTNDIATTPAIAAGMQLNLAGGVKSMHLNVADIWAASGDLAATLNGTIVFEWTFLS